jgi:hypothetical protein
MGLRDWITGKHHADEYGAQVRHYLQDSLKMDGDPIDDSPTSPFARQISIGKVNKVHPIATAIQIAVIKVTYLLQGDPSEQSYAYKLLIYLRFHIDSAVIAGVISEQEATFYDSLIRKYSMNALLNSSEESDR